ncbi:MAG: prepilin peptidase [Hydrogenophilaceae bacterium]|nr:prepilin peptidase [Hydrogenophilaceae bacterium]
MQGMDALIPSLGFMAVCALLVAAAFWDLATMTIPNWLSLTVAALFPVAAVAAGLPWWVIAFNIGFGLAALLGCFFLFNANVLGGGDAKLIPAAAMWTGAAGFAPFAIVMTLCGGLLALVLLVLRRLMKPAEGQPAFLNRLLDRKRGAPYGVAIAAGAIFALMQTPFANAATLTLP